MVIDISDKRLYNPLFFKLQKTEKRFICSYGGKGSGKSYSQAQFEIMNCLMNNNERCLIIRKYLSSLEESVVQLIKTILNQWKIYDKITHYKNEKKFIFPNGSEIICKGADDSEKLKSITGITRIWIEEATELDEGDFLELNSRLRGKGLRKAQITLSYNPTDETHWIKKVFFDTENFNKKTEIIRTTCRDNQFIDTEYINQLESLKDFDYNRYRVEYLGEWGKIASGGEVYNHFTPNKHVKDFDYNPNIPIHLSFDENVNPYLTCLIIQIYKNNNETEFRVIDEICIPNYNLEDVCREFTCRFPNHQSGLFVYGDASSKKNDSKLEHGYNFFTLIQSYLMSYKPNLLISKSNPAVVMRINWINNIFYKHDKIKIYIHSKCKETIKDFQYCKRASDGTKDKTTHKNKITGVTEQKYGHTTDACEYALCYALQTEYYEYQGGNTSFTPLAIGLRQNHRF
jgi:phage terminase large subunit